MASNAISDQSAAALIARYLKAQGVRRVYGLCGGHIMPIWMRIAAEGIRIVDVRDERAAVYMAHAEAELGGGFGVALVTAGPGVTNAMTGIANAHIARAPVMVLSGVPPGAQENRGALQDVTHTTLVGSITRYARTVRHPDLVLQELDEALARARGIGGEPGPVYLDFPVDVLRATVCSSVQLAEYFVARPLPNSVPDRAAVEAAVQLLWSARRPLFISGRGARGAGAALSSLLERLGAAYLDTGESRGLIADDHPSVVAAMRGSVMGQADLVVTVGRRLDFQLAYGSPAIFGQAQFVRIADCAAELRDNRRGAVELLCTPRVALEAINAAAGERQPATDQTWSRALRAKHVERSEKLLVSMRTAESGSDGLMHPNRALAALRDALPADAVVIADGGDFLSLARVGLPAATYMDPGSLGCIGVGTAFGVAASLVLPQRTVVGTQLQFADHAAMARAFGMYAERVEKPEQLAGAIERAMARRPALLDVLVTPQAVSSDGKSGLAWVPDLQPLAAWNEAEKAWRGGDKP